MAQNNPPTRKKSSFLINQATEITGLSNWGDNSNFEVALDCILKSSNQSSNLTELGHNLLHHQLIKLLTNRLYIENALTNKPELLEQKIVKPLFIISLPRTGTTLLQSLLSCDTNHRSLLFWEAFTPAPKDISSGLSVNERLQEAENAINGLNQLSPDLAKKHEFIASGPQECYPLLENSLMFPSFHLAYHLPDYLNWLSEQDIHNAYRYYFKQLQIIQNGESGKRWLLKAPLHMHYISEILDIFPDACIIQLHRDPLEIIPSACSLISSFRAIWGKEVDTNVVGDDVYKDLSNMLSNSMKVRSSIHSGSIVDINYYKFIDNPILAIRKIYDHFGFDYNQEFEKKMVDYSRENYQHKHGKHTYTLDQFGLSEKRIKEDFKEYYDLFLDEQR